MTLEKKTRFRNPIWLDEYEVEKIGLIAMPRRRGFFIVPKSAWNDKLDRQETVVYWRSREPEQNHRREYLEVIGELKEKMMDAYDGIR